MNCIDSDGKERPVNPNVIISKILFGPKGAMSKLDHNDWKIIQFVLRMNDIRYYTPSIKEKEESILEKKKIDKKWTTMMALVRYMVAFDSNKKPTTKTRTMTPSTERTEFNKIEIPRMMVMMMNKLVAINIVEKLRTTTMMTTSKGMVELNYNEKATMMLMKKKKRHSN